MTEEEERQWMCMVVHSRLQPASLLIKLMYLLLAYEASFFFFSGGDD